MTKEFNHVIFFDGICNLCNHSVDFIIRQKHGKRFLFAPLQGKTYNELNIPAKPSGLDSIVYLENGVYYIQSSAALKIMNRLGGWWKLTSVFYVVPTFLRDLLYKFIANNRYRWYGKKESCRMPSSEEKELFLP